MVAEAIAALPAGMIRSLAVAGQSLALDNQEVLAAEAGSPGWAARLRRGRRAWVEAAAAAREASHRMPSALELAADDAGR